MGLLKLLAAKRAKAQIEDCVRIIHISTAMYIGNKYEAEYDEDTAAGLGAAVANTLFGFAPGNEAGTDFLAANISLVDSKLREIAADSKICRMVSVCAYVRTNAAASGAMATHPILQRAVKAGLTPELLEWLVKMKDFGILLPDEQIDCDWPSSMDDFMRKAREFEMWVLHQLSQGGKA